MEPPILCIRLFGELDLRHGEAPLPPLASARAKSLLAYLLLHQEAPQPRQRLAFLLWPDSTEPQAHTNLRHVLHNLRRTLPDPDRFLHVTPRTLQWRVDAPCWLDVAAFEAALARAGQEAAVGGLAALQEAVELYTGDLLEGCYDEWLLGEREQLRQRCIAALERLTEVLEARRDYAQAILYAERLLRQDPLHEETYRLLMRLHNARGDRARALRVYHVCAATLERELGIHPSTPTREAYETLLTLEQDHAAAVHQPERVGGPQLVGRVHEWTRLTALWRAAERGRAQFVLVTGEPGIGKTRLIEEFRSWCAHRGAVTADARSYPAEGALAYGPVVAWLRSEALEMRRERLDRARLTELARLLPELLSEVPDLVRPEPLPESDQRQRLFDAIARAILAPGVPLLLVADDLHWCDRETLQFLHYLLRVEPGARLLVAASARREEIDRQHSLNDLVVGLHALECFTEIELGRFTQEETAVLAERIVGHPLGQPEEARLYAETEGNPLFVVEALRAGWMSGHVGRGWMSPRVQIVIESRLAQLSEPARELAGLAATIGRAFTTDVLAVASEADEATLVRCLDELWRRRIVREHGANTYDFSHDKIREVAYAMQGPARRRHHHLRIARALERVYAADPGPVSGELAAHYEQAGAAVQAITWYERAAEVAQQMHAGHEAVRLLDRALDLLRTLPSGRERDARELQIFTGLLGPLGTVEGYTSARMMQVHQRALALTQQLGVDPVPPLLRSLAVASLCQEDFEAARQAGEHLQARGERDADDVLLVEAAYTLGIAAFWSGELDAARRHFEAAVEGYRPDHRRAHLVWYGQDPKVLCLSRLGNTRWLLGYPDEAVHARDAALALAGEIEHPASRATALVFAAILALDMRDLECLRQYVAMLDTERSAPEARYAQGQANATAAGALNGLIDVLDGRSEAGITRIRRVLDELPRAGYAPGQRATMARLLVEARAAAGDMRAALVAADQALAMTSICVWEADIRRRRAEFLAALGAPRSDVEAEIGRALQVARCQGARSLELRAAASLLRYRLDCCDGAGTGEARHRLAQIVGAFPVGQDTYDLREAATLLARR